MGEDDQEERQGGQAGQVLFCPFCKEAFEGERDCPDHDIALVSFEQLPQGRGSATPREDEPLSAYDPRLGRGLLFAAAVLTLIGFLMPFATTRMGGEALTMSGFEMAARRPLLWAVPFVAGAMVVVLAFRRTPRQMRGARLAIPMLATLGVTAVAFGVWLVHGFAADRRERFGMEMEVTVEPGVFVMAVGLLLALVAGFRLGAVERTEILPHGATIDDDEGAIVVREDE